MRPRVVMTLLSLVVVWVIAALIGDAGRSVMRNLNFVLILFTKWLPETVLDDRKSLSIAFFFFTKWLQAAILDDRKSLLIAFLGISDQYPTFFSQNGNTQLLLLLFFVHNMAASGHVGSPKITFDRISRHFRSLRNFYYFHKMAAGGHFG